jgi:hypothetical protein
MEGWRKDRRGILHPMNKDTLLMMMTLRTHPRTHDTPPDLWIPERNEEDAMFESVSVDGIRTKYR